MGRRRTNPRLHASRNLGAAILCALAFTAHASPATPVSDLQSSWGYDCYSPGQACGDHTGVTRGSGTGTRGCSSINSKGCSQYSFNGGGQYKLCQYSSSNCGNLFESGPDGGTVSCVVFGATKAKSWKVVARGHDC